MLVALIITAVAIYVFREQIGEWIVAMWKDDMPDE